MNISIFGLGKLGLPLAACLAHAGHAVLGTDLEAVLIQQVNSRKAPFFEPGLDELLADPQTNLRATLDAREAVWQTDVSFIVVPTPSKRNGRFSLKHVVQAVKTIGRALRPKKTIHHVIVTSTLMPGSMRTRIIPLLEKTARKRVGHEIQLYYKPEFIALGSVIANLRDPDLILIGTSDPTCESMPAALARSICHTTPPVCQMSYTSAELVKLGINTFITTKIAFANMLGEICERLPDSDVDAVTAALGLDGRIGSKCLRAGLGYGGPCFPRDNQALQALASALNVKAPIPRAVTKTNNRQQQRLLALVHDHLPRAGVVGILGLAYKANTPVVEKGAGFELARRLTEREIPVVVHDPHVTDRDVSRLRGTVHRAPSAVACARQADVLVVCTTPAEDSLLVEYLRHRAEGRPLVVIDCWRAWASHSFSAEVQYRALGRHFPAKQVRPMRQRRGL